MQNTIKSNERIRKELLESFKYQQRESRADKEWLNGIKLSEVVAFLESTETIYIVYETDGWNRNPIIRGTFDSFEEAVDAVVCNNEIPKYELDDDDGLRKELELCRQTQGYSVNYNIEETAKNAWI